MTQQEDLTVRRRFGNPGRASLNRGLAALAVAAAGYLLGFLLPWALSPSQSAGNGRFMFMPIGGIASFVLAFAAIMIGTKTKRFIRELAPARRERIGSFVDLDRESGLATRGVALGIASMVANPLIGFVLFAALR